jgi:hypothetical protein
MGASVRFSILLFSLKCSHCTRIILILFEPESFFANREDTITTGPVIPNEISTGMHVYAIFITMIVIWLTFQPVCENGVRLVGNPFKDALCDTVCQSNPKVGTFE